MRQRKGLAMALAGLCLALALAACQPGSSASGSATLIEQAPQVMCPMIP